MFKNIELSKLKNNRRLVMASVSIFLIAVFILIIAAWSNNSVNIYDGENVQIVKTKKQTVKEVLDEAGYVLGDFDKVEPELKSNVYNGMDIRISRAVKLSVSDDGVEIEYYSWASTVQGVLDQTGYTVGDYDCTVPDLSEPVEAGMVIEIHRAKEYTLIDNGKESTVYSCAVNVGDLINELSLGLSDVDSVNLPYDFNLKEGMKIKITRRTADYEDVRETIGYKQVTKETSSLAKGKTRVKQEGQNGIRRITYEVIKENGEEVERREVSSVVEKEPVNKIVEVGTYVASQSSAKSSSKSSNTSSQTKQTSSGKDFSYSNVITCSATAYDLSYESCGKRPGDPNYGVTASGMKAQYGVVAVDPGVIPLGTKLYVEATDGSWTYGYCVAGDTGGGIRGNRIDLFFNSRSEALQFGRRQARVYILN